MTKKLKIIAFLFAIIANPLLSEDIQEIIILEKKLSSLNGWSNNQSISSIGEKELSDLDAQHPKQIFRRAPGVWISRGSGQEHLTAIRSPVLSGPGACGSFLVLEDGLPVRPTGFCNVNGLFETENTGSVTPFTSNAITIGSDAAGNSFDGTELMEGIYSFKLLYGESVKHGFIHLIR